MNKLNDDINASSAVAKKAAYKVPFGTVSLTDQSRKLIDQALESKWVTRGKYVDEFEKLFAKIFGVKHAVY